MRGSLAPVTTPNKLLLKLPFGPLNWVWLKILKTLDHSLIRATGFAPLRRSRCRVSNWRTSKTNMGIFAAATEMAVSGQRLLIYPGRFRTPVHRAIDGSATLMTTIGVRGGPVMKRRPQTLNSCYE